MSASGDTQPDPRAWERWQTPPGVPDPGQLGLLTAAASAQATAMLAGEAPPQQQDPLVDAVRLLATAEGARFTAQAAGLTGVAEDDLRRLVLAYRHGGTAGVAAMLAVAPCDAETMAAAVDEVHGRRAFAVGDLSAEAGTITDPGAGVRLRLGPDGRWYPCTLAREPRAGGQIARHPPPVWVAVLLSRQLAPLEHLATGLFRARVPENRGGTGRSRRKGDVLRSARAANTPCGMASLA